MQFMNKSKAFAGLQREVPDPDFIKKVNESD
jgi:hypothetical protein